MTENVTQGWKKTRGERMRHSLQKHRSETEKDKRERVREKDRVRQKRTHVKTNETHEDRPRYKTWTPRQSSRFGQN